jgi:uncharacterized membrane-anchored protein
MGRHDRTRVAPLALIFALLAAAPQITAPQAAVPQTAAEEHAPAIQWAVGPTLAELGDIAQLKIPEGYAFTGREGTRKLLERTHNLVAGNELGAMVPNDSTASWFVIFQFNDVGFVKDDDKDKIDADALLKTIREGTEEGNKERKKKGWNTYEVVGWEQPPFYDAKTQNLTWAIRGQSSAGHQSVNHSVRILGRRGTMDVDLVLGPEEYVAARPQFESVMQSFSFSKGSQYADFVKGDKVAAYGLSALVLGGAGALAVKTGFFAKFWKLLIGVVLALKKLIVVVVLGIGAALKSLWGRFRGAVAPKDEVTSIPPTDGTGGP